MEQFFQVASDYLIAIGPRLAGALAILFIGIWAARLVSRLSRRLLGRTRLNASIIGFLGTTAYFAFLVFVLISALGYLGIPTTSFVAVLGAAGLAIGLALQGTLANFASGVMLLIFRPFTTGHFINAGNISGTVEEIHLVNTCLRTPDNKVVFIPNGKLAGETIINFSMRDTRRVDMVFGISYESDLRKAKQILADIINGDERILSEPEPLIAVLELADSSVNLALRPWVRSDDYWPVLFETQEKVKLRFDETGIVIPYPQQDVHLYSRDSASQ